MIKFTNDEINSLIIAAGAYANNMFENKNYATCAEHWRLLGKLHAMNGDKSKAEVANDLAQGILRDFVLNKN